MNKFRARIGIFFRNRWVRAAILTILIGTGLMGAFLFYADACVRRCGDRVFSDPDKLPENEYGLLLGTAPTFGGVGNRYFHYRIDAAARLYHAGKIRRIIVSGDNSRKDYNEPEAMRQALMAKNVPDENILSDYAGFRTLDSVIRAGNVFNVRRFTVISQRFHCERAVFIADHHDMDAVGFAAQDLEWRIRARQNIRETISRGYAWIDVNLLNRKPHFPF